MSHLKVVLLKDHPSLGKKGEIVEVKSGYGRNFLLPQKWAVLPTAPEAKKLMAESLTKHQQVLAEKKSKEQNLSALIGQTVQFQVKINKQGKLFKAIQAKDIAKKLNLPADRIVTAPLKKLGKHQVTLKSGSSDIKINVDIAAEK